MTRIKRIWTAVVQTVLRRAVITPGKPSSKK